MPCSIQYSATPNKKARTWGLSVIELGERFEPPPRLVARRPAVVIGVQGKRGAGEPVEVRGGRAVFQQVIELIEAPAGVIEHPVEDDTHAAPVRRVEQPCERGIPAEERVNLVIVVRVIAMIRGRLKDGAEIQRVNAKVREIVEVVDHAQQIAALEAVRGRRGLPGLQVGWLLDATAGGKPIGKDVIEHRILDPVRGQDLALNGLGGNSSPSVLPRLALLDVPISSNNTFASWRSAVSKPSVNQP